LEYGVEWDWEMFFQMPDNKEFFIARRGMIGVGSSKQQQILHAVFEAGCFLLISYAGQ
jgi:hypothetical protein